MDVTSVSCDVCHTMKQETNHWMVAIIKPDFEGILFQPAESTESPRRDDLVYEDLCGQRCCQVRLGRYLDELKSAFQNEEEGTEK